MTIEDDIYHHGYHVIDSLLPESEYIDIQRLIHRQENTSNFIEAQIGANQKKSHDTGIRRDQISWLDPQTDPALMPYFQKLDAIRTHLNQSLFLGLMTFEAHFSIYYPGDYYKKHVDQFHHNQDRKISCVYYLNADWQPEFGGALCLYDEQDLSPITILPQPNRLVCFKSNLAHEVLTTHHSRYSIAAWLKARPIN